MGRFVSPDWSSVPDTVPYADINDPQTLNLYAYAGNNPLSFGDPDGHQWTLCDMNGNCEKNISDKDFDQRLKDARAAGEYWVNGTITLQDGSAGGSYKQTDVDLPGDPVVNQAGANMIGNGGMGMVNEFMTNMALSAVGDGAIEGLRLGAEALMAARAAKAADKAAQTASQSWKFGAFKSATKWSNQLLKRGWTESEITETIAKGERYSAINNVTTYVSSTGKYVVMDNVTNEVIQVGDQGMTRYGNIR